MKKLIAISMLLLGSTASNADIINPYKDTMKPPPSTCDYGMYALADLIIKEPKKAFGVSGNAIANLPDTERSKIFKFQDIKTDSEEPKGAVCSVTITINPQLDAEDRAKLEKVYPIVRLQLKIQKSDNGKVTVTPVSTTKLDPVQAR